VLRILETVFLGTPEKCWSDFSEFIARPKWPFVVLLRGRAPDKRLRNHAFFAAGKARDGSTSMHSSPPNLLAPVRGDVNIDVLKLIFSNLQSRKRESLRRDRLRRSPEFGEINVEA